MSVDIQIIEKYLQRSVEEFDSNPLASRLMRRLSMEAPDLYFTAAVRHLNSGEESNAHRMMAILLLRNETLFNRLVSPAYGTRESSVKLFRRLLAVDPSFDVKLARRLPGRSYWSHAEAFDTNKSERALDILDETSRGRRLLPILGHLPDSEDPRISAKATLFVGKRVQNPAWSRRQLNRADERVRANAVEALWGVNTAPAVRLLEDCISDRNNRVVGNSIVGLHIAGKDEARREVMSLSRTGKPELRSTAAWAMGKIATPVFASRLTELVRDEHPQVRSMALRSLMSVRRVEETASEAVAREIARQSPEQIEETVRKSVIEFQVPSWAR